MLPRLLLVEKVPDFWAFSNAGRNLADIHLNYEEQERPKEVLINGKAYDYIVNGKSSIEWIMEHNNSRYILDLFLSVITVSIKTVNIVAELPKAEWK